MVYGKDSDDAVAHAQALALRVVATMPKERMVEDK
jgi:hypothetical protein